VFYVFLVDVNVESQEVIQQEIRARRIVIVNDAGQEVVELSTNDENNGGVIIYNKNGNLVAKMGVSEDGGGVGINYKNGISAVYMGISEEGGAVAVYNKVGTLVVGMGVSEDGGGVAVVGNKVGTPVAAIVGNKVGTPVAAMMGNENDNGEIEVFNKSGEIIGTLP
jgi:hypothetical protein